MGGHIRPNIRILWWESCILWLMVFPMIAIAVAVTIGSVIAWTFDIVTKLIVTKSKL